MRVNEEPSIAHRNPVLNAIDMERLANYGTPSDVKAGAVLICQGDPMNWFVTVVSGEPVVEQKSRTGAAPITTHGPVQFFGDVHSLSGRPSLVQAQCAHENLAQLAFALHQKLPLARHPYLLESSIPGVFAAGEVRAGSVKRVASGVGEGSLTVNFVHRVLGEKSVMNGNAA